MEPETQTSESFGTFPQPSEEFGTLPNHAESFRTVPKTSARTENHILSVREVARMFENAGVPRTERSVTNWCRADASGVSRLDAYFDFNERRYFITPQSVERAIQEELAKARVDGAAQSTEAFGSIPKAEEGRSNRHEYTSQPADDERIKELERKITDLEITNRGKDYFIEQLQHDRAKAAEERMALVDKLTAFSHQVGTLETHVLALEAGRPERVVEAQPVTPANEPISVPVRVLDDEQQEAPQTHTGEEIQYSY
jgi:hypothetical protein